MRCLASLLLLLLHVVGGCPGSQQGAEVGARCDGLSAWLSTHHLVGQVAKDICMIAEEECADLVEDLLLLPAKNFEHRLSLRGLRKVKFNLAMKALRTRAQMSGKDADRVDSTGEKKKCRWGSHRRRRMKKAAKATDRMEKVD